MRLCAPPALHDELTAMLREDPVTYCSSGTTGTPKTFTVPWEAIRRDVSPRGSTDDVVALGFLPRTYAGLSVLAFCRVHGSTLLAWPLDDIVGFSRALRSATHLSTTPTYMHRLLLCDAMPALRQITLGGEAASASLLQAVAQAAPHARITQVYASSERGVSASWSDGRAGIPASCWSPHRAVESDRWECRDGRWHFRGRAGRLINVAGQTVDLAVVEQHLRDVPGVIDARAYGRPSSLTGQVLMADVVTRHQELPRGCALSSLPRVMRPLVRVVPQLDMTAAGKAR